MTVNRMTLVKRLIGNIRLKKKKRKGQQFLFPEMNYEALSEKRVRTIIDSLFEIMKKSLENDESILITGFGKFQVKFKWARKGRNPQTGETIVLDSRRVVSFRCSSKLKEKINSRT